MQKTPLTLAQRREALIAVSSVQRESLALQLHSLMHPLSHVDAGLSFINRMRARPSILVGLVLSIIAIKPRRLKAWFRNGLAAWQTWRSLAPAIQGLLSYRSKAKSRVRAISPA